MSMEKIIIYPYDGEFGPVIRHKELLKDYEIVGLVSPMGWGLTGKDAGEGDNGGHLRMIVSSNFDTSLELCDTVLFSESRIPMDFNKYIMPKVVKTAEAHKNILFTMPLTNDIYNSILNACHEQGVCFRYFNYTEQREILNKIDNAYEFLYDIDTPVIFVLGTGERTNKFEIQLALRDEILKMGYKLSQIGTRGYCKLLGFHSFPGFMYSKNISETDKIILFNRFVRKIEIEESPDVIVIGIPGSIMPFNNNITNKFGILAYEVSQAVTADASILSSYYGDYDEEYFNRMVDAVKFRLGCKLDCYNISNVLFDWQSSNEERKMIYTSLDTVLLDEKVKKYKTSDARVFNVLNGKDAAEIAQFLIGKLSEYGEAECI